MLFSEWTMQIFAFVVVGAFFVGMNYFGTSVGLVLKQLTDSFVLLSIAIYFFAIFALALGVPMLYGLFSFEINALLKENCNLSDIFCVFSDKLRLFRCYAVFFRVLFKCILCFAPAFLVLGLGKNYLADEYFGMFTVGNVDVASFVINTVFVVLAYLGIVLSSGTVVGIFISVTREDLSVDDCFFVARKCIRNSRFELGKMTLSFLPLFVVSLFSIGFLFVLYTLPYMLITGVMFSKYLYDKYNFEIQMKIGNDIAGN